MKVAILGLPQAGKRTLFTLLTGRPVPENRKPGESIEGTARIRDPRVDVLSEMCRPKKTTYPENSFVLCPDLDEGPGKRSWLEIARRCDLLCLLVRAFESDQVYHPAGSLDAERDREAVLTELILADLEMLLNRLIRIGKEKMSGQSAVQANEERALKKCEQVLEDGRPASEADLLPEEAEAIKTLGLVTRLPILWALNVSEDALESGVGSPGDFEISCQIEKEIASMEDATERAAFLEDMGLSASGLDRMNAAAYDALGLMSFYTIGSDEVRAWTIRKGSAARTAGGKIHSDIARGFIRVEVIKYEDLISAGSEQAAKSAGRVLVKGRDYVMEDGDICHFLFNV